MVRDGVGLVLDDAVGDAELATALGVGVVAGVGDASLGAEMCGNGDGSVMLAALSLHAARISAGATITREIHLIAPI